MVIGTAGHIDHGKSALVEALTGVHPDRLPEERRRGITLDLGFGHVQLEGPGEPVLAGLVDVPGHERLVRTMLAGAGGFDAMLLVVAADAGVQPQTREHFAIARLLGLERGVIALTKCDLADGARRREVRGQLEALAAGSGWERAPVVEVSARSGEGMAELRAELWRAAQALPQRTASAPFRLPVDRSFSLQGFGTVVTGTLAHGCLEADAEVEVAGESRRVRVRGLQSYGRKVAAAAAGERVAVNLAGVEPAEVARGTLLGEPGVFEPASRLEVELELLPGVAEIKPQTRIHAYFFTAERLATLRWLERAGDRGWAQLRLEEGVAAAPGDRFILRQLSPALTLGGGRVLDTRPPRRRAADREAAGAWLRGLRGSPQALMPRIERAGRNGIAVAELARAVGRRNQDTLIELEAAAGRGDVVLDGGSAMSATAMAGIEAEMLDRLGRFHAAEPLAEGASLDQIAPPDTDRSWAAAAMERLRRAGRVEAAAGGSRWRIAGQRIRLSPAQEALRARLAQTYAAAGLAAPARTALLAAFPQPEARRLLDGLVREGALTACQPDWLVATAALQGLRRLLAEKAAGRRFTVPEFKAWTGLSRKHAIPLLEYLDRIRVTRRVGEARELVP